MPEVHGKAGRLTHVSVNWIDIDLQLCIALLEPENDHQSTMKMVILDDI